MGRGGAQSERAEMAMGDGAAEDETVSPGAFAM